MKIKEGITMIKLHRMLRVNLVVHKFLIMRDPRENWQLNSLPLLLMLMVLLLSSLMRPYNANIANFVLVIVPFCNFIFKKERHK